MTLPNVIILTAGLSGSSVLARLLARAGYNLGAETTKKPDYDTGEDAELVALNQRLLAAAAPGLDTTRRFDLSAPGEVAGLIGALDPEPYREFAARAHEAGPFLWKDPRLWATFSFWAPLLDHDRLRIILLEREPLQWWTSTLLRRQVYSFEGLRRYNDGVGAACRAGAVAAGLAHYELIFEDLLLNPAETIAALNSFLGTLLKPSDLEAVYDGELGRRRHGPFDHAKAALIYGRNALLSGPENG